MQTKAQLRNFVRETFYVGDELRDDTSLLEQGIVDSTGILEVIMFLENTFGMQIEDAEIVPENLDTIDNIAGFVARKTEAPREASG